MTIAASPSATAMMISRRPSQALDGAPEGRVPAGRSTWAGRRAMPVFYSGKVLGTFAIYHREVRNPTVAERQVIRDAAASAAGLLAQMTET